MQKPITMRRAARLLAPGEHVQLISREHGITLAGPFLGCAGLVAAACVAALAAGAAGALPEGLREAVAAAAAVLAGVAIVGLVRAVLRWQTCTLVVTDRRALLVRGTLAPRVASVRLDAIEDIEIRSSPAGRIMHYGRLVVSAGGRRGALLGLRTLPDPDLVMALLLGLTSGPRPRLRPAPTRERLGAPTAGR